MKKRKAIILGYVAFDVRQRLVDGVAEVQNRRDNPEGVELDLVLPEVDTFAGMSSHLAEFLGGEGDRAGDPAVVELVLMDWALRDVGADDNSVTDQLHNVATTLIGRSRPPRVVLLTRDGDDVEGPWNLLISGGPDVGICDIWCRPMLHKELSVLDEMLDLPSAPATDIEVFSRACRHDFLGGLKELAIPSIDLERSLKTLKELKVDADEATATRLGGVIQAMNRCLQSIEERTKKIHVLKEAMGSYVAPDFPSGKYKAVDCSLAPVLHKLREKFPETLEIAGEDLPGGDDGRMRGAEDIYFLVFRELIRNSINNGARQVTFHVRQGEGCAYWIEARDDGDGLKEDPIPSPGNGLEFAYRCFWKYGGRVIGPCTDHEAGAGSRVRILLPRS